MLTAAGAMFTVNAEEVKTPVLSVTRAVNSAPPGCVGVPERTPEPLSESPWGKLPPNNVQE